MMMSNQLKHVSYTMIFKRPATTPSWRLLLLCLPLWMMCACSSSTHVKLEPQASAIIIPSRPDAPLNDASLAYIDGDFTRVQSEMYRTCLDAHWSMMTLAREPEDGRNVNPSVPDLVICTALMTNGLSSEIYSWQADNGKIAVAVRAGPFGNPKQEKLFIDALATNLAKAPVPDRSKTFDMPTLKQYQQSHEPAYE